MRLSLSGRLLIIITAVLFVATVTSVALALFVDVRFGLPTKDKTAVINTVVAVGAFALVGVGRDRGPAWRT